MTNLSSSNFVAEGLKVPLDEVPSGVEVTEGSSPTLDGVPSGSEPTGSGAIGHPWLIPREAVKATERRFQVAGKNCL